MANGAIPNPLAAPLMGLKQISTQSLQAVNGLNTSFVTALNQGVDALIAGAPPLPGVPGAAATGGLPSPQSLLPGNLTQALSQIENVLIPPGLPKPSQAMAGAGVTPPAAPPTPPATPQASTPQAPAPSGRRVVTQMRGL